MSALDDLLGEFEANAGKMPQVNPPEATKVLAAQTAPEVAGEPEPVVVEQAPPAPTEKPAEVKAAEQAKARKPRGKAAQAAPPDGWDNVPAGAATSMPVVATAMASGGRPDLATLILALSEALPKGTQITIRSALDP